MRDNNGICTPSLCSVQPLQVCTKTHGVSRGKKKTILTHYHSPTENKIKRGKKPGYEIVRVLNLSLFQGTARYLTPYKRRKQQYSIISM